ncbi:hypothetical protein TvY486_0006290 [Trypanosoma vivax Y486]|uniref:Uncharacterized protein n=1 Tax=Trypanosoma vivax (strain Y486) TaxID=1055687 RepID=F9WKH5_TRYVY|nr:hypothetical protein TvY486_0006290 [Trypanosoma vivax Y486]|eukprot:CCD17995.1 hypothetical protein TvY486_0006290 [Trypanosoma vivax Y486]
MTREFFPAPFFILYVSMAFLEGGVVLSSALKQGSNEVLLKCGLVSDEALLKSGVEEGRISIHCNKNSIVGEGMGVCIFDGNTVETLQDCFRTTVDGKASINCTDDRITLHAKATGRSSPCVIIAKLEGNHARCDNSRNVNFWLDCENVNYALSPDRLPAWGVGSGVVEQRETPSSAAQGGGGKGNQNEMSSAASPSQKPLEMGEKGQESSPERIGKGAKSTKLSDAMGVRSESNSDPREVMSPRNGNDADHKKKMTDNEGPESFVKDGPRTKEDEETDRPLALSGEPVKWFENVTSGVGRGDFSPNGLKGLLVTVVVATLPFRPAHLR